MNKNGRFRTRKVYFTQVSNSALRDTTLSLKAKGLYSLIQSYITIEDFSLYKSFLRKNCVEGEKAFESTWKELKDKGYLIQYRLQDDQTKHFYYEYDLLDEADTNLAEEIHNKQNRKNKEEKTHTPKKEVMEKSLETHTPKMDTMAKVEHGKRGVYNKTNINKTNINKTNNTTTVKNELAISSSSEVEDIIIDEVEQVLTLTENQKKKVRSWEHTRLIKAIAIFKELDGEYFKLLEKIYKDDNNFVGSNKINSNSNRNAKSLKFNNFTAREYDYDSLEKKLLGWE